MTSTPRKPAARPPANPYVVQPVLKALRVLEFIVRTGREVSLTEAANELESPKTTIFRYLQTLAAADFLSHDRVHDRYGVGLRFRVLATADGGLQGLVMAARPAMSALSQAFHETINLAVAADREMVYVHMIVADRALRMQTRVGDRDSLHSTALGKAILAFLPEDEQAALLPARLRRKTNRTVVDRAQLVQQLQRARTMGYAMEISENEEGAMCIAAPILDDRSRPIAAISLAAPQIRMSREIIERAAVQIVGGAREIARQLSETAPRLPENRAAGR